MTVTSLQTLSKCPLENRNTPAWQLPSFMIHTFHVLVILSRGCILNKWWPTPSKSDWQRWLLMVRKRNCVLGEHSASAAASFPFTLVSELMVAWLQEKSGDWVRWIEVLLSLKNSVTFSQTDSLSFPKGQTHSDQLSVQPLNSSGKMTGIVVRLYVAQV